MIKINDKLYNDYNIKISWGNFEKIYFDEILKGISPFIKFNLENNIFIGIETCFSKQQIENMKLNEKTNIKQYITDIIYEDENGWISIIIEEYDCDLTKINANEFKIEFFVNFEEDEKYNIAIDTNIEFI